MVESKYVHEALFVLSEVLVDALENATVGIKDGLTPENNAEKLLESLRKVEVASELFKSFLTASYNDDKATWTFVIPKDN